VLTGYGALLALGMSIWPGVLEELVFGFLFVCVVPPLLACWWFLLVAVTILDLPRESGDNRRRWGLYALIAAFITVGLLWLHVPQRAVFFLYCSEFRRLADDQPADGQRRWELQRRIGPYFIDRWGRDRAGGVYFRTHTAPDGIGPDFMEYGFTLCPVHDGVPFGRTRHRVRNLFGDWYVFEGSDD
jgi:hypothetical protein